MNRSSSLITKEAAVCSDHLIASKIGLDILKKGGNAADAAVGTFAAVSILSPFMCGLGGDIQCIFYKNIDKSIQQINGSGKTGKHSTLEKIRELGIKDDDDLQHSIQGPWVSIPGAPAGIFSVIKNFGSGKLTMSEILEPAVRLAEEGAIVQIKAANFWKEVSERYMQSPNSNDLLINGKLPEAGDVLKAPKLAQCYKDLGSKGATAFYRAPKAQQIVEEVQRNGGNLTLEDFENYLGQSPSQMPSDAISVDFHGYRVWEMKPNTIGIVVLVMLNVLSKYDLKDLGHNSAEYIHLVAEATKLSYRECWNYLCDPKYSTGTFETLLTHETTEKLQKQINLNSACQDTISLRGSDTSYMATVDPEGNGCSFIASILSYFGSGLVPNESGFVLNDRLKCMSLDENSTNAYGPDKIPLHTILPSLVTDSKDGNLLGVLGVVGRWMQPQGQVQVLLNMIIFGMDPQTAVSQPRFFVGESRKYEAYTKCFSTINLEEGHDPAVVSFLENKGHKCSTISGHDRERFGKGHIIARNSLFKEKSPRNLTVWWSGVDPRCDSYPVGF